jgi:hypothetical protein
MYVSALWNIWHWKHGQWMGTPHSVYTFFVSHEDSRKEDVAGFPGALVQQSWPSMSCFLLHLLQSQHPSAWTMLYLQDTTHGSLGSKWARTNEKICSWQHEPTALTTVHRGKIQEFWVGKRKPQSICWRVWQRESTCPSSCEPTSDWRKGITGCYKEEHQQPHTLAESHVPDTMSELLPHSPWVSVVIPG